jgi:proteic killer suppression protein
MVRGFHDDRTRRVFHRERVKGLTLELHKSALRKLLVLDAAESLQDLRVPPGNRLEKLVGNRQAQYSIRVNNQWRICFRWSEGNAEEAELVDYH